MNTELFLRKKKYLGQLVLDGFQDATYCHRTLFDTISSDESDFSLCLTFLNRAHTYLVSAELLYMENIDLFGERNEFELLFHQFNIFNKEVLDNIRTNHSHQWSDIEFRAFVDAFKVAADLLSIDKDRFWAEKALREDY